MNRRRFLSVVTAPAVGLHAQSSSRSICRITLAAIDGRHHKFVAMNSYQREPKGHSYTNTLIRIQTRDGIEGIGVTPSRVPDAEYRQALGRLLGVNPLDLYEMTSGCITGRAPGYADVLNRYRHLDGALFDLIGKLTGKPAWRLIGKAARERVEAYDGTLYFSDLWFPDRGVTAVVEEAEEARKKGYTGIKLKVGRGSLWMEREAGLKRDIEVVRAVRKAMGPKMRIMADPNNAHDNDLERAWRFVAETADTNLYWLEELFPEQPARYAEFRAKMQKAGIKSLIADGESVREASDFEPYLRPKQVIDVFQMDIRWGGFLENLKAARMAEPAGAVSVPHNWGSQIGGLMAIQLSKAVRNVPAAEDDRSTCDAIVADGYEFRNGSYAVPDKPGLSIRVDEAVYEKKYKANEVVIA